MHFGALDALHDGDVLCSLVVQGSFQHGHNGRDADAGAQQDHFLGLGVQGEASTGNADLDYGAFAYLPMQVVRDESAVLAFNADAQVAFAGGLREAIVADEVVSAGEAVDFNIAADSNGEILSRREIDHLIRLLIGLEDERRDFGRLVLAADDSKLPIAFPTACKCERDAPLSGPYFTDGRKRKGSFSPPYF